ncbi:MAG: hypothetical protein WBB48_00930 [Thermodesulfobacteriota bacterium]
MILSSRLLFRCLLLISFLFVNYPVLAQVASEAEIKALNTKDVQIEAAQVSYMDDLDLIVFELTTEGQAGKTVPNARGELNGAPVLGYVFPTNLKSEDVGFNTMDGVVALAVTAHPDFDDTPLWDENNDRNYENDGVTWHTHWVVLGPDKRVKGGLSAIEFKKEDKAVVLPPTNPGMPMFMDSPGYSVVTNNENLKVLVPAQRIDNKKEFNYDAVSAYMEVNTTDEKRPLLGVYEVFDVLSGDLSLPYKVK